MLLTSPIVRSTSACCGRPNLSSCRSCAGARPGLTISRRFSNRTVMSGSADSFGRFKPRMARASYRQRLVDILDDIGDVFDADRKADGFRQHASHALLFAGHLAVGGRGWMAGERFRIANINQPRDQVQRVIEGLAGLEAALDAEGEQ